MSEIKAKLLEEMPYQKIHQQPKRTNNKYVDFFGSYLALPLISIILIVSLLILFLIVKAYFSNSYIFAMQESISSKNNNVDISAIADLRHDRFSIYNNNNDKLNQNAKPAAAATSTSLPLNNNNNNDILSRIKRAILNNN